MTDANEVIRDLFERTGDIALAEVERLARKVMRDNPEVTSYFMANGCSTFDTTTGGCVSPYELPAAADLDAFLDEWDDIFGITGHPMLIDGADGERIGEWTSTEEDAT